MYLVKTRLRAHSNTATVSEHASAEQAITACVRWCDTVDLEAGIYDDARGDWIALARRTGGRWQIVARGESDFIPLDVSEIPRQTLGVE